MYHQIILGLLFLPYVETKLEGTNTFSKRLVFILGHTLYILRLFQVRISLYYNYSKT